MRPELYIEPFFGIRKAIACVGILLCFALFACSNSEGVSGPEKRYVEFASAVDFSVDSHAGMLRVQSDTAFVVMGTAEPESKLNERPEMLAHFDYEFSIGRHEVTCSEFNSLMEAATGLALDCDNGNLPATDMTFYDAVLYANERSKAERLDTAYTYVGMLFDGTNHCTGLDGFAFRPEANAYRLPTEAEWMLVARNVWDVSDGWTADNSDYKAHEICAFAKTEGDVCDMVGNAMEWVNDWLGEFRNIRVTNFVGAPDGGSLGERVVKGGSFRNPVQSITPYGRGDVYTVVSSTHADYVGFRLAFGAIPNAQWMDASGDQSESRVIPLASSATIRSLAGTYRAKLVFRNDVTEYINYIDYSGGTLSVKKLCETYGGYHPDISPDGKWVAYSTGLEGVSGESKLYVAELKSGCGNDLVKLDVKSAAIPRWRVLENGDTAIVYVTDAGNNKDESAFKSASTWQVKFSKGKFGKPEKLFDGAYHDGISEDGSLAVSGARLLRARVAESGSTVAGSARDTVWYGGEQACNVSLAKDSSKRSLFLDFGGTTGHEFVGENYGTHERLFVIDSTGKLMQSLAAPAGYSFDHSEWARGGDNLAVATLTNAGGAHSKIVLLNLADSSIVELAEGDELWHPALWVKQGVSPADDVLLDIDSAGVYLVPGLDASHEALRVKMELFWNNVDRLEYILVGSSRVEDGLIPDSITAGYALNMGHPMNSMDASFYIARNYALNHAKNLKAVVFSLDFDLWQITGEYTQELVYGGAPGYAYDQNHDFWKSGVPESFVDFVKESYPASEEYRVVFYGSRGYHYNENASWGDPLVEVDSTWLSTKPEIVGWQLERLRTFVSAAQEKGVAVVGIVFPQNPKYRKTGAFGRYGLLRDEAEALLDSVHVVAGEYPNFYVMDENRMGAHDYTDDMALNTDHLAYRGAVQVTARLDSLLNRLK